MFRNPEKANLVNFYYETSGSHVGLTLEEVKIAREAGINLGHCSSPGTGGHNEYVVPSAGDRGKLRDMFA